MAKIRLQIARVLVSGLALTLLSALYSQEFNWPDYYHIEYGLPLSWMTRTLSTIIGPTDKITFQPLQFILDLVFWSVVALLAFLIFDRVKHHE